MVKVTGFSSVLIFFLLFLHYLFCGTAADSPVHKIQLCLPFQSICYELCMLARWVRNGEN